MIGQNPAFERTARAGQPRYLAPFRADLISRLQSGAHLILHGPRGSGKSTFLASMRDYYQSRTVPCAIAPQTLGLSDVVTALSQAYPKVDLETLSRRAIGSRLCMTADRTPGVLLLDHTRELTTATIGFLRRLRRALVGVLLVVDIDSEFERDRLRTWRRHALCARMPLMPNSRLRRLLQSGCSTIALPAIEPGMSRQIVHAARGRVGWLCECVHHLESPAYWSGGRLHVWALCIDCEIAVREGRRGPRMRLRKAGITGNS
jgi:hypothetical protein